MSLHSWICIRSLFFSLLFFWKLHRCENVCISHWQGKKENKPQPFLYTKLQGGWQNSSLNALWCCLFERSEPSPALWSGFPAHMPLQMLFSLVPTSSPSFSVLFLSAVSQLRPPCSSGMPPRQFCKTSSSVFWSFATWSIWGWVWIVDCILLCIYCKSTCHYGKAIGV